MVVYGARPPKVSSDVRDMRLTHGPLLLQGMASVLFKRTNWQWEDGFDRDL
jgi:hypothetical protein